jgi:hypothetical protein
MSRRLKAIKLLLVLAWLTASAAPVAAQEIRINPVPPQVKPQWTPVPNAPGVYWAPNIPTDVFRHGSKYYFYWADYLYQGSKPKGPWKGLAKVPAWFSEIDPAYFKTVKKEQPTAPPAPAAGSSEGLAPKSPAPAPPEATPPTPAVPEPEKEGAPAAPPPPAPGIPPKVM